MTKEEIIRNLKYTIKKHKNDRVNTFDINIAVMCKDILEYLEQEPTSPCDLCRYNPPSSCDGKPCTMCPAQATERFKDKLENGYFRKRREV